MSAVASPLPGVRKAAILLVLLGEDAASRIYRNLPEGDLEHLTQEIAEIDYIDPQTALAVLQEYHRLAVTQDYLAVGGTDYARKLLVKAFGEEAARQLLSQVSHTAETNATKLDSLNKADPQQLAQFLEIEHPQTIALILAHMDAKQASVLLMKLPEALRAETIKRMAQLRQFSPEIGKLLTFSRRADETAELLAGDRPVFHARVARRGNNRAAHIVATIENKFDGRKPL